MKENSVQKIENKEVVAPQKKYIFRKLKATDIGLMTSIIKKIGINKVANCFKSEDMKKAMTENKEDENLMMTVGMTIVLELVQIVVDSYDNCEADLYKLLSNISNLGVEEVQNLEFDEFFDMLFDFFKKDEFMGFLNRVLKLLGMAD